MKRKYSPGILLKNTAERRVRARGLHDFQGNRWFYRPGALAGRVLRPAARAKRLIAATVILAGQFCPTRVGANPVRPVVTQGSATFNTQGSQLTIQTSGNAFINWSGFNIGTGETTTFVQPSSSSLVWNRINDNNPSQILGNLNANGYVILQNQAGFYVGGQAAITASGLVMTTSPTVPLDISGGGAWQFNAPPPTASIINYGQINAGTGGSVFLISHDIENHGTIAAPGGNIGLYAGKEVLISSRPDGRGLSAQVSLPEGSVDNSGKLIADAGTIALHAQVVNQGGLIQANSVREANGVIEIVAGDSLNVGSGSRITASGGTQGASAGGNITLRSGSTLQDAAGSVISVAGGRQGGNGGTVEVSAPLLPGINSAIDGHASAGATGGRLLIDPTDITLNNTGTGSAGSGTVGSGSPPTTLSLNVNSAFTGFSQIDLQATHNITLSDGTTWNLAASTGISTPGSHLVLEAGNNINLGTTTGASIQGGTGWSVTLEAGRNFSVLNTVVAGVPNSAAPGTVTSGTGNITLAGNSTVQTQDGSISVLAGNNLTVNNGAIRTVNGGNIDATAVAGNVNTGKNANAYLFSTSGYSISGNLGGISTGGGGNVNLTAGGDVTSFLPTTTTTSPTDAGSGAFGTEPGVVTVKAGGNVYGHYVAADSVLNGAAVASTITALNGNAGAAGNLLALSLINGGWQVNAPNGSIYLQEVRNPNGVFNGKSGGAAIQKHLFDYGADSFVDLTAGNAVFLEGTLLPRYTGDAVPVIYPPTLEISAGPGGLTLGNNLTLFPSPRGELNISTTDGGTPGRGSFEGAGFTLAMSDSGATAWNSTANFATDHASSPVQLSNPNPVVLNIAGNLDAVTLVTPKATHITVGGEVDNTSFSGQNLHPDDVSFINVAGRIYNQNTYSFADVGGTGLPLPAPLYPGAKPDYLQLLENAVIPGTGPGSANAGLQFPSLSLFYLPATLQLGYYGKMDSTTEQLLLGTLHEKTFLPNGQPVLDANGNYVTTTASFAASPAMITALYTASQNSIDQKSAPLGFQIGGPGEFDLTAKSLDLGVSGGIVSEGPAINPALATLPAASQIGAKIVINLDGDLDMFTSQISSYYGGAINVVIGGTLNAGIAGLPFGVPFAPYGIWTSGHSDVSIIAGGDINVAGSRIAAFDGGNILVESLLGNVDAGTGNFTEVKVNEVVVNPRTHQVSTPQQPIAGSGILATTLPDAPVSMTVGNVTVLTPRGNINASDAGIVQEPLNGNTSLLPTLSLTAGTRDSAGNIVYAGNISAGNSGVIGINTSLNAAGNISGLVIARGDSTINAAANVSGTFLAGGTANFSAVGTISGIAIGGVGINVGSGKFEGVALSQSVSGGGAQTALATTTAASTASQTASAQQENSQKAETSDLAPTNADDEKKKGLRKPLLTKYVGRVTVILPNAK